MAQTFRSCVAVYPAERLVDAERQEERLLDISAEINGKNSLM